MTKRRKTHDGDNHRNQRIHNQDDDYIPLPIQTFLWRQTSPFVRPYLLKKAREMAQLEQRDACKLFERIIITNNIWGQSPSLTDAISSIDRWRLIKVSFPFVLQCTAALLNNKLIKDHNFNRLGGNEAKMMYTLQWILMNASEECADSENEAKANATNVAIAAAKAASLLKPSNATSSQAQVVASQGSTSSTASMIVDHQHHHYGIGAPPQSPSTVAAARAAVATAAAAVAGQSLPSTSSTTAHNMVTTTKMITTAPQSRVDSMSSCPNQSIIIPAASTAATSALVIGAGTSPSVATGVATLQMQTTLPSSSSVSPIGSSTPTKPLTPNITESCSSNYLLPISSIQMFVYYFAPIMEGLKHSDFLTSNQRLEIGAALWEPLFNHQLPSIQCLTAQVKPQQATKKSQDSLGAFFTEKQHSPVTMRQQKQDVSLSDNRRRSSSMLQDQSQFGDVFLGGPTQPIPDPSYASSSTKLTNQQQQDQTKISKRTDLIDPHNRRHGTNYSPIQTETEQLRIDISYATYLDVAVLRCLFISDWQEAGVYWAITFLINRLEEIRYKDDSETEHKFRPKSNSLSCIDYNIDYLQNLSLKFKKYLKNKKQEQILDKKIKIEEKQLESKEKTSKSNDQQQQHGAARSFLRVEDAEASDSGGDCSKDLSRSPVRRLSFSSSMQTLANQIRKTSKRVKKTSDNQQMGDSVTSESQSSIHQSYTNEGKPSSSAITRARRSSSADDLNSAQVSILSKLQKESISSIGRDNEKQSSVELHPVITVSKSKFNRQKEAKKGKFEENKQSSAKNDNTLHMEKIYSKSLKRLDRLTRSQTVPDNLHISSLEIRKNQTDSTDSMGATHYIDDAGRIDPIVLLKVLHSISQRENACSQRVCDRILSLVSKLISIGILKENFNFIKKDKKQKDLTNLLPTRRHEFKLLYDKPQILMIDSEQRLDIKQQMEEAALRALLIHKIMIDIIFRLYHHLGCPNQCGMESTVNNHHQNSQSKIITSGGKSTLTFAATDLSGKQLRSKLRASLEFLCDHNKENFIKYVQALVNERSVQQIIDIFHSILGFCRSDYLTNIINNNNPNQNLTTTTTTTAALQHNQSVQFLPTPSTSGTNLNENTKVPLVASTSPNSESSIPDTNPVQRQASSAKACSSGSNMTKNIYSGNVETVESMIITNSFKQLITRLASINKELKLQENTSLYCDIRRLITLIRDNYNSVFRSIVLSALIDCAKILNQQQKLLATEQTSNDKKKPADNTRPPSDDESTGQQNIAVSTARGKVAGDIQDHVIIDQDGTKMTDIAALSCSSSAIQQSPLGQNNDGSPLLQHRTSFGSCRYYPPGHSRYTKQTIHGNFNQQDQQHSQSTGILSLSKAKKKLEQVFGGGKPSSKVRMSNSHLGEDLAQSGSLGPTTSGDHIYTGGGDETSRRASIVGHQSMGSFQENALRGNQNYPNNMLHPLIQLTNMQLLKQNQQIYLAVQTGMTNFSFLMESCAPGDFLDPALLAALLDLKSPIAIRAAIYLECANFVHRCNRGQWPSWMKMNVSMHRGSNAGIMQSSGGSKFRKSSSIQRTARSNTLMYRAAGKAFYSWAEAIGARLEELLQIEQESIKNDAITEDTENDDNHLTSDHITSISQPIDNHINAEIDFFQPTLGNTSSPFALKMAACQLLFEVTTFLRETYRYLPPTIIHHQAVGSKLGEKMTSIYDVSRAVTANRRWSMALSSLGFGQLPATLSAISASAAGAQQAASSSLSGGSSGTHLKNPTTTSISEHPERRISFILHETNDENEQDQQKNAQADGNSSNAQSVTSPLAQSVNTNEQQQDAMRKMTAGRHLSQSSASSAVVVAAATCLLRSSGVIDSQTHRRKSIKLRKTTQDKECKDKRTKFAQDLDEENENSSVSDAGMRRTDSLRSRRRVSGISEKSDTSDRANNGIQNANQDNQQLGGDLSGDESAGNGSCEDGITTEAAEKIEADDSRIMSNMPWFKAVSLVNSSIDCNCTHYPSCRPYCYKLHQNMCKRLITCVQSIYQDSDSEQNYAASIFESRLANLMNLGNQQKNQDSKNNQGELVRAGSDCSGIVLNQGDNDSKPNKKDKKLKKFQQQQLDSPHNEYSSPKSRKHDKQATSKIQPVHFDSMSGCNGISTMLTDAVKALTAVKAKKRDKAQRNQEEPQIVKYMRGSVKSLLHCPMSSFLKGAVILPRDNFIELIRFSWNLLLEDDQQLSRTAAVGFIISSIKCPTEASKLLLEELESADASKKVAAINKFYVIWDARYQCWPRLEDGAFVHFKMAPPSIEFTLPSPKIAQESKPVVDPPWMPRKTSNVEEVTIGQDQTVQKSFVTATKTRRKQQIEIVTRALREKHDKLREDRENYHITSVPITLYAAYEPTLSNQSGGDELDGGGGAGADEDTQQESRALLQMKTAQALFPTCLCQAAIVMINLLDDSRVTYEGSAVYEIASKVIWSCLVEDPALFLRHFFERLTRQNQSTIFQVLRRLIRFMPRLPPQAAYTLYNYLIGFIIYYIRCPVESSQKLIADTLSVLCLVVPSVYGLFLKDLKQILRKEQCDHNLLITANVPSAKKIIVHGSDSSGIPSQFPIDEATQFYHILVDSLEFFGIDKPKQNEYFLIDVRTNHMHNVHSYVRDYYSFKRSQHPQLQLINMDPNKAFDILQRQELINQFLEFGKVSMSLSIVKSTHMAVQRVLFLHEELMKLPTFPRKALETNFCLFRGPLGHQVFSMDRIHKICWVRVMARMFELTSGFFLQLGDIHLFLNAISGIFVLHCEEASVSRLCLATFINATYQFKSIFASDGFMPIMATIVQVYSNHQNNQLLCRSIEFVCKQFYIMHRKPFLLQLFGSVASRLNTAELMQQNQPSHPLSNNQRGSSFTLNDPSRISPAAFFRLLQSLEKAFKDPLDILELVEAEKPLRAVDFCYQQDKEAIEILDIISLCVTVTAYASDSPRSTQMLIILETVVPLYMKHLQASTSKKAGQSMGKQAHKDELQKIQSISICIRTLIVNCEGLTRNFNGPLPSIDFRGSSIRRVGPSGAKSSSGQQRNQNNSAGSPMDMYNEEVSFSGVVDRNKREQSGPKQNTITSGHRNAKNFNSDENEITRGEFIVPRDTLLNLVAEFLALSTGRLMESAKKYVDLHQKHSSYELLDVKSHLRLAEVANSLLKFASTDPTVMACRGLTRYMNEILPNTEWRQEAIRPALIMILKRLDKTFNRISKKTWVKRSTDWEGAKQLLKGAYLTFVKHPYIVHLPHLKSLITCCQNIILSDGLQSSIPISTANLFHGFTSNQAANQPSLAVSQSASVVVPQLHSGERQLGNNYLNVGTGHHHPPGTSLSGSSSHATSAPIGSNQQAPSFAAVTAAAAMAERLAANAPSSSITSQGFNSVTIRLIAMQLLQTGDSQTLESFVGNSMNTAEKLESLMLNFLYPMCIRVCSGAREAPKLRVCDIMYILNIVLNMLAPQSASSKGCSSTVSSPKAATDTSQFILSKITTTIGSTQTGATALNIVGSGTHSAANAHQLAQHQENLKIGFLGLKILCVCFETQLASEWIRISRVIRDLALQAAQPSGPLWDFLDFVATYRFPMFILLLPMIKCHLSKKVKDENNCDNKAHYMQCKRLIDAKIQGSASTVCRSKSFLFVSLTAELRMLKEQLIAKRRMLIEGERQLSSHPQQSQSNVGGTGGLSPNQANQAGENALQGDHSFTAYHRLSAALASFANQGGQGKLNPGSSGQLGTSAALKGTCFAAQLATSTPIGPQISDGSGSVKNQASIGGRYEPLQSSIRLSGAKSREEARKVMNTILRRTSYPHNQVLVPPDQLTGGSERKNSQPPSPTAPVSSISTTDIEATKSKQIIMDPAMLMAAAFPAPRKSTTEGSGILKQLINTIDRNNQKQKIQTQPITGQAANIEAKSQQGSSTQQQPCESSQKVDFKSISENKDLQSIASSKSQMFAANTGHKHS